MKLGPDAARYWYAAEGRHLPRPFHLRWALPRLCGHDLTRWWAAWGAGWLLAAAGMFALLADHGWQTAAAGTVLLLALPGFIGPSVTIPIGVDIPATGLALCGAALCHHDWWHVGILVIAASACIRETTPIWAALWVWSPVPLIALAAPLIAHVLVDRGPDPLGDKFQQIADHPVRAGLTYHQGRWRDAWLMVAPWGVCLAALVSPSWPLLLTLAIAYGQLLIATDTVRLYQHAAGPAMAAAAATQIPTAWLPLALAVHVVWWRTPERV